MKIKKLLIIVLLTFPLAVNAGFDITDLSWAKDVGARSEPQGKERLNVTSFGAVADGIQ